MKFLVANFRDGCSIVKKSYPLNRVKAVKCNKSETGDIKRIASRASSTAQFENEEKSMYL